MNSRASALALRQSEQPVARFRKLLSYLPKGLLLPLLILLRIGQPPLRLLGSLTPVTHPLLL